MNARQRRKARRAQERAQEREQLLRRVLSTAIDFAAKEYAKLFGVEYRALFDSAPSTRGDT
jgi:hypothetical protein